MRLSLFHDTDTALLDLTLSSNSRRYQDLINDHVDFILRPQPSPTSADIVDVTAVQLDGIASLHCDKWLEGAGLHMNLYSGALQTPALIMPPQRGTMLSNFPTISYKSFSGDVSGTIGEALFALLLLKRFGLQEDDFTHFGASAATGIFPDFGIHALPVELWQAFRDHRITGANLTETHLIPAEVKAMVNPDRKIVKERFEKAVLQVRNFWQTRKLKGRSGRPIERGASIIFLALRNTSRQAYDGVIVWMG